MAGAPVSILAATAALPVAVGLVPGANVAPKLGRRIKAFGTQLQVDCFTLL